MKVLQLQVLKNTYSNAVNALPALHIVVETWYNTVVYIKYILFKYVEHF